MTSKTFSQAKEKGTNDHLCVQCSGTSVVVMGVEPGNDTLIVDGLGGNDTIDASAINAGWIILVIDGGDGNDTITVLRKYSGNLQKNPRQTGAQLQACHLICR